jgi:hypothetical protein
VVRKAPASRTRPLGAVVWADEGDIDHAIHAHETPSTGGIEMPTHMDAHDIPA